MWKPEKFIKSHLKSLLTKPHNIIYQSHIHKVLLDVTQRIKIRENVMLKMVAKPVDWPTIIVIIQNMCLRHGLFQNYTMPTKMVSVSEYLQALAHGLKCNMYWVCLTEVKPIQWCNVVNHIIMISVLIQKYIRLFGRYYLYDIYIITNIMSIFVGVNHPSLAELPLWWAYCPIKQHAYLFRF